MNLGKVTLRRQRCLRNEYFLIKEEAWTSSGITFTRSFWYSWALYWQHDYLVPNWVQVLIYDFTFVQGLPIQLKLHIGITRVFNRKREQDRFKKYRKPRSPLSGGSLPTLQTQSCLTSNTPNKHLPAQRLRAESERNETIWGKCWFFFAFVINEQMGSLNFLCVVSLWECFVNSPTHKKSSRRKTTGTSHHLSGILERSPPSQGWRWVREKGKKLFSNIWPDGWLERTLYFRT